jgi:GNAT superfamily N-acetyltransferase
VFRSLRADDLEQLWSAAELAQAAAWLARQERGEMYVAVAEVDGVPVGRRCLDLTLMGDPTVGFAFGAGVVEKWRRRGIASALEKHLEEIARARGLRAIRSTAVKHNAQAIRWHEHIGDRLVGDGLVRWTEYDGREVERDCWMYERSLEPEPASEPGAEAGRKLEPDLEAELSNPQEGCVTVTVRQLRAADVDLLFAPVGRGLAAKWLRRQERGEIYVAVAEVEGEPVGRRCLDLSSFADRGEGELFAAVVRPEWRSRGVATAIQAHLDEVARRKGLRVLRSVVVKGNERARRWHERIGDRLVGERLVRWTEPDGRKVEEDCWDFERELGSASGKNAT